MVGRQQLEMCADLIVEIGVTVPSAQQNKHASKDGKYGAEGHILQAYHPLPDFGGVFPMCGVWLVASEPAGMCIREDRNIVTTDDARFLPHVILD